MDFIESETTSSSSRVQELEKELQSCKAELKANKQRIDSLLDLLTNYVQLDFSDRIDLSDRGDEIDALSAGLIVLGEELEARLTLLNNSRNQFESLVNNLPVGVLLQDQHAKILFSNPMSLELLGLTENQLLGKTSFDKNWKVLHEDGTDFPGSEHPVPRAIATLAPVKGEIMVVHRPLKNDWVWLKVNALPLLDGKGKLIHVICSFEDITAAKKAEKELLITRNQLQNLLDHSPAVTYSSKAVGDFGTTFVSENIKKITGYEASEFTNNPGFWQSKVHPDDLQQLLDGFKNIYEHDEQVKEYRFKHKNGKYRWMQDRFHLIQDEAGDPMEIVGTWIDIDESKPIDARIQNSEKLLAESQKAAHVGSWEMDVKTRKIYWSDEMYRILGYKPQEFEVAYEKYLSCIHPDDLNQVIAEVKETEQGHASASRQEFRIVRPDGSIRYLSSFRHVVKNNEGETIRVWGTSIDITEEWKAKSEIQAISKLLAASQRISHTGSWEWDISSGKLIWSDELFRIFGLVPQVEEMTYEKFLTFVRAEDKEREIKRVEQILKEHQDVHYYLRIVTAHKVTRSLSCHITPVLDEQGALQKLTGTCSDVTEALQKEEELSRLSLIAKETINPVIITNRHGKIEWVNEAFTKLTEYELHEVIEKKTAEILHGRDTDPGTAKYIANQIATGNPYQCEIEKYTKSGKLYWVVVHGQPMMDDDGQITHYFNIETDITVSKSAFQKLMRLESETRNFAWQLNNTLEQERTRIAREIHDELGQQMVGIKMSVSALKVYCKTNEEAHQQVERIVADTDAAIRAIRKITLELRPALIDSMGLFAAIEWVVKEFGLRMGVSCEIKIGSSDIDYDKKVAICFFRICQEALTNIAKHAQASQIVVCISQEGDTLSMIISDNGIGIARDEENITGMGLLGMKERAQLIGAKLIICRGVLRGTEVNLTVQI